MAVAAPNPPPPPPSEPRSTVPRGTVELATDADDVVTPSTAISSDPVASVDGWVVEAPADVATIEETVVVDVDVVELDTACEALFGAAVGDGTTGTASAVAGGGVCDSANTVVGVVGATVGVAVVAGGGEGAAMPQSELFNGLGG